MSRKIKPARLTLDPPPARIAGTSMARTIARTLRAWRRGERPALVVLCDGSPVTPEQVDWSAIPAESSSPGGRSARAPRSIRLSEEQERRLAALAERWGTSENAAVGRAIDAVFSSGT